MRPEVIILSIILLCWLVFRGCRHNATCPECQTAKAGVPAAVPVEESALSIDINDADLNFSANTTDNLIFAEGACDYQNTLSDNLQTVFQNTVQHLNDNSRRILVLTGLYEGSETNSCSDHADLGIARAEKVKGLLVGMGAPTDRIELEASEIRDLVEYESKLVGGVDYLFRETEVAPVLNEEELRAENITLYFDTNDRNISFTTEQEAYFNSLKNYLEQNPSAKAMVTGHTDDQGKDAWNMRLSRKRADFVKEFMIDKGISARQIDREGLGPDQPIATNSTDDGRALNRRVEITLQ